MNKYFGTLIVTVMSSSLWAGFHGELNWYNDLLIFPHQVAIADVICTGTVVTNCNGEAVNFDIDDTLWGHVDSSNITIRCACTREKLTLMSGDSFLVFAFTNNWWLGKENSLLEFREASEFYLADFLSPTNRPPDNAVFPECRIMDSNRSVFNLNKFESGGTNYWPGTRTFITNFLEITRIQQSETNAFRKIDSILSGTPGSETLPPWMLRQLLHYNWVRYNNTEHVPRIIHE